MGDEMARRRGASGPQTIGKRREGNLPFVRRRGGSSCKRSRADRQVDGRAALRLVHICNGTRGAYVRRALRQRGMVDRRSRFRRCSDTPNSVRTFIRGGNLARAGLVENLGAAAAVLDLSKSPGPVLTNQRLEIARNLVDVVSLTTFQIWNLPGPGLRDASFTAKLHQAGTDVALSLELVRATDGNWSIVAPTEDELSAARKALLARSGGRRPEPSAYLKLGTARDTYAAFQSAFADWDRGGPGRVIETPDTSELFPATRDYEAQLAAQYLKLTLDRVSTAMPQEIPDDPADHQPYVVFSNPTGTIAIAPIDAGGKVVWRFTANTLKTIRALYSDVEAMLPANARVVEAPPSTFFAERGWFRKWSPSLMRPFGPVESWQMLAGVLGALFVSLQRFWEHPSWLRSYNGLEGSIRIAPSWPCPGLFVSRSRPCFSKC